MSDHRTNPSYPTNPISRLFLGTWHAVTEGKGAPDDAGISPQFWFRQVPFWHDGTSFPLPGVDRQANFKYSDVVTPRGRKS